MLQKLFNRYCSLFYLFMVYLHRKTITQHGRTWILSQITISDYLPTRILSSCTQVSLNLFWKLAKKTCIIYLWCEMPTWWVKYGLCFQAPMAIVAFHNGKELCSFMVPIAVVLQWLISLSCRYSHNTSKR